MKKRTPEQLVGKRVKSRYRARWTGLVVSVSKEVAGCVWVVVDTDQCGHPLRTPIRRHLHIDWLEKLP